MAGRTVLHLFNPIFQYIFDCLGKRSIRSISKIVAFGAQKIETSPLRSRWTHNEWLIGSDFGTVSSLGYFSLKMRKLKKLTWTTFDFNRMGPTCHTAYLTIDLLRTVFEHRIIRRNTDVNWPPRSCDLTRLDCFLWGAVKDKCFISTCKARHRKKCVKAMDKNGEGFRFMKLKFPKLSDLADYCGAEKKVQLWQGR